jgi:tetratricopeptide (TPR) repeat protein
MKIANLEADTHWTVLKPSPENLKSEGGATLTLLEDGSILASGEHPADDVYTVTSTTDQRAIRAIRLEALTDDSMPLKGPGRANHGWFVMNGFGMQVAPATEPAELAAMPFAEVAADFFPANQPINPRSGYWHLGHGQGSSHVMICRPQTEIINDHGTQLIFKMLFKGHEGTALSLGRFRLSVTDDPDAYANAEQRFAAMKIDDPWTKLAAAYRHIGDQASFDRLLEQHPQAAAGIGDLYAADEDWQRAIDIYSKLITDDTTDATLLARRAVAYIATEQWDLAKADWLRVIELQPDQLQQAFDAFCKAEQWSTAVELGQRLVEQTPDDSMLWLKVGAVIVLSGNENAYTEFCQWIARQPLEKVVFAERAIKSSLLRPSGFDIAALPVDTLTEALDSGTYPDWFWGWQTRSMLAYRSGDAESAVKYVAKSEEHNPIEVAHATNQAILALAQHELGKSDEAKAALAEATLLITSLNKDPSNIHRHDLLIAEILFREAESKINGKTDSAAETADSSASSDKTPPPTDSTDKDVPDKN